MKRTLKSVFVLVACSTVILAQQAETRTGTVASSESSAAANKNVTIQSGTHIRGELQKTIDVRNAKVGDRVVLKTTETIKSEGRKLVNKGALLFGQVTEVTRKTKAKGESRIAILFDKIKDGSLTLPITATIDSINHSKSNARLDDDVRFRSESNAQSTSGSSMRTAPVSGGGGGGLVGSVSNTVGGAANSSTMAVGDVLGATTAASNGAISTTGRVASTTDLGRSLSRIQISESSTTSADGSTVLSLANDNLRLEKGTTFNLTVSQSANLEVPKQP
ncbi:MAG TPA: hypothetical protein VI750_13020 [Pyrinomonadaceae bacterium]|nr:hypothetical protein [Pyrinomonadaceae bacterium]